MFQPSRVGNGSCSLTLQVFEQALYYQVPVHLIYLDPTADVLDVKVIFSSCARLYLSSSLGTSSRFTCNSPGMPWPLRRPLICRRRVWRGAARHQALPP